MFYFDKIDKYKIMKSDISKEFECFFTTREFPLYLAPEAENNLQIVKSFYDAKNIYMPKQTHSSNIALIEAEKTTYEDTDALIANQIGTLFFLNFADCVPVVLYDNKQKIAAIAHAGWRGTKSKIVQKTVQKLKNEFKCNPKDIVAIIGPAIGECCFEVGKDVYEELKEIFQTIENFSEKRGEKYFVDLKSLNKEQLLVEGIEKIDKCDYCTCCQNDIFFSYRKENGNCARHSAVVYLK